MAARVCNRSCGTSYDKASKRGLKPPLTYSGLERGNSIYVVSLNAPGMFRCQRARVK